MMLYKKIYCDIKTVGFWKGREVMKMQNEAANLFFERLNAHFQVNIKEVPNLNGVSFSLMEVPGWVFSINYNKERDTYDVLGDHELLIHTYGYFYIRYEDVLSSESFESFINRCLEIKENPTRHLITSLNYGDELSDEEVKTQHKAFNLEAQKMDGAGISPESLGNDLIAKLQEVVLSDSNIVGIGVDDRYLKGINSLPRYAIRVVVKEFNKEEDLAAVYSRILTIDNIKSDFSIQGIYDELSDLDYCTYKYIAS